MMAASPSVAAGFRASGLSVRKSEEIADLIDVFSKTQFRAKEVTPRMEVIEKRCLELFARDYKYSVIHNPNGEVCGHYPRQIVFLEYECTDVDRDRYCFTTRPIRHFPTQSPDHSVTNYPFVCLCPTSHHAHLTVVQGAKVNLHPESP
ncbi:hypothetical protein PAMP_017969 [Pampus punctatissimus]